MGESGSTLLLTYQVTNPSGKLMVLRNIDSSLCPNQGVVGVIAINGHPEVTGKPQVASVRAFRFLRLRVPR